MAEFHVDHDEYDGTNAQEYGYEGELAESGEDLSEAYQDADEGTFW